MSLVLARQQFTGLLLACVRNQKSLGPTGFVPVVRQNFVLTFLTVLTCEELALEKKFPISVSSSKPLDLYAYIGFA